MSAKRLTPVTKKGGSTGSTFRTSTPGQRQNSFFEPRLVKTDRKTNAGPSQTTLDISTFSTTLKLPVNRNILPKVDHDLECDLAYADHLQSLLKEEIISKSVNQHQADLGGQLCVQKDNLHKTKLKLREIKQDLLKTEQMVKYKKILEDLEKHVDEFMQLSNHFDLTNIIKQLISILNVCCNKMTVENIVAITEPEDFVKLELILKGCTSLADQVIKSEEEKETIQELASFITKCEGFLADIKEKQVILDNMQKTETHKLFKSLSDSYAKRIS